MRITEPDFILPALYAIDEHPDITTGELIIELEEILNPQGEDAEILANRTDTKFSQIVRNLVSHDTLVARNLATYTAPLDRRSGGTFVLTENGRAVLSNKKADLQALLLNGFPYERMVDAVKEIAKDDKTNPGKYIDENIVIKEGGRKISRSTTYERSLALRTAAIEHYRGKEGDIACAVCGFDFHKKYGDLGTGYIEIHHEQPLFLYEGEKPEVFLKEAVKTVKPLCSNCHRMIHLGPRNKQMSLDELKAKLL